MHRPLSSTGSTRRGLLAATGSTRRGLLTATVALLAAAACTDSHPGPTPSPSAEPDPADLVAELTRGLSADNPYRNPTAAERSVARRAVRSLFTEPDNPADPDLLFGDLGFTAQPGTDPSTNRPYRLYVADGSDDRTWGALLVDRDVVPRTVIGVPHPGFDINTEKLGLALHRRLPASVLVIAGAHRQAGNGTADVAHNKHSMFHTLAVEFARLGLDHVQLHGFADKNLPASDAVVSTGAAPVSKTARRIADGLAEGGLKTCRAWSQRCGQLEGKTNQQGQALAELKAAFIHLELSWSVRGNDAARDRVATTLADCLTPV